MTDKTSRIFAIFTDFANSDLQRRSWFGIGPEVSSPDEMCNQVEDLSVRGWVGENVERMSPFLGRYIYDFLDALDSLPEVSDPWTAFSSVEWMVIRLKATVIRDLFATEYGLSFPA